MPQRSSDVLTNIYNFILIDIIQILLIFLNHLKYILKKFLIDSHVTNFRQNLLICLFFDRNYWTSGRVLYGYAFGCTMVT